jgi:hypothetical protein
LAHRLGDCVRRRGLCTVADAAAREKSAAECGYLTPAGFLMNSSKLEEIATRPYGSGYTSNRKLVTGLLLSPTASQVLLEESRQQHLGRLLTPTIGPCPGALALPNQRLNRFAERRLSFVSRREKRRLVIERDKVRSGLSSVIRARNAMATMARISVVPEAAPVGALPAQLRRPRPLSATSAKRRFEPVAGRSGRGISVRF